MASAQNQSANVDLFDAYFRRAGLDLDDRISGNEAVAFFQGSGLPKQVRLQIWARADQRLTGFLGQAEYYNALRIVTVAQSKRELTPEMLKAALYGPGVAKIPAPAGNSASSQSHMSLPRITQADVQKYTNIFVKVDTDRDGKITGAQARTYF